MTPVRHAVKYGVILVLNIKCIFQMLYLHKEKTQTININRTEGQPYPLLQNPMTLKCDLDFEIA